MNEQEEFEFANIINAGLEPTVVSEGNGWLIAHLTDNVYEAVFTADDLVSTLEASKAMVDLGLTPKTSKRSKAHRLADGRVTFSMILNE